MLDNLICIESLIGQLRREQGDELLLGGETPHPAPVDLRQPPQVRQDDARVEAVADRGPRVVVHPLTARDVPVALKLWSMIFMAINRKLSVEIHYTVIQCKYGILTLEWQKCHYKLFVTISEHIEVVINQ